MVGHQKGYPITPPLLPTPFEQSSYVATYEANPLKNNNWGRSTFPILPHLRHSHFPGSHALPNDIWRCVLGGLRVAYLE